MMSTVGDVLLKDCAVGGVVLRQQLLGDLPFYGWELEGNSEENGRLGSVEFSANPQL